MCTTGMVTSNNVKAASSIMKPAWERQLKFCFAALTVKLAWDENTVTSRRGENHGKNFSKRPGVSKHRTYLVLHQVGYFPFRLRRDLVCRACRQLSGGSRHPAQRAPCARRSALSLKATLYISVLLAGFVFVPAVGSQDLNVYFKTTPRIEMLGPFADPADLARLITDADGRPVDNATVNVRLDAPAPGR